MASWLCSVDVGVAAPSVRCETSIVESAALTSKVLGAGTVSAPMRVWRVASGGRGVVESGSIASLLSPTPTCCASSCPLLGEAVSYSGIVAACAAASAASEPLESARTDRFLFVPGNAMVIRGPVESGSSTSGAAARARGLRPKPMGTESQGRGHGRSRDGLRRCRRLEEVMGTHATGEC